MKYVCTICGYIYDDDEHDVLFENLPDDWTCPLCTAPKAVFEAVEEEKAEEAPVASVKYKCTICGYIYEGDITKEPDSYVCPLCGAPKEMFELITESKEEKVEEEGEEESTEDLKELTPGELSILFSNLARGCEKQYQDEAKACFEELSSYFEDQVPEEENDDLETLANLIKKDLDKNYKELRTRATNESDRGTLRIVTWGEKVTRMIKSLLDRYAKEGDDFLRNTNIYICTVCGFLYIGDKAPDLCPVCKVPSWKFEKINGRVKK